MKRSFWMAIGIVSLISGASMLAIDEVELNPNLGKKPTAARWSMSAALEPAGQGKMVKIQEHWPFLAMALGGLIVLIAKNIPQEEAKK